MGIHYYAMEIFVNKLVFEYADNPQFSTENPPSFIHAFSSNQWYDRKVWERMHFETCIWIYNGDQCSNFWEYTVMQ